MLYIMKRSNSRLDYNHCVGQKREVIQMMKSGKYSSSDNVHFGITETTGRNIKKKWAELDRYEITLAFGSPARLNWTRWNVPSQTKIKIFGKIWRFSEKIWTWFHKDQPYAYIINSIEN